MESSSKGLNFARGILEKYGWKEGKGLGRLENGLLTALKPALKFDSAGIGYDHASQQFTSCWWEKAYDKSAKSIDIVKTENDIQVKKNGSDTVFNTKETRPVVSRYDTTDYDFFVKTAVLTQKGTIQLKAPSQSQDEAEGTASAHISDEEVFRICKGRTVHKGARHGLKLGGKLARIQRQEEEFCARLLATDLLAPAKTAATAGEGREEILNGAGGRSEKHRSELTVSNNSEESKKVKRKHKKKVILLESGRDEISENSSCSPSVAESNGFAGETKKRKKEKSKENNEVSSCNLFAMESVDCVRERKRKKKRKKIRGNDNFVAQALEEECNEEDGCGSPPLVPSGKKKKKLNSFMKMQDLEDARS